MSTFGAAAGNGSDLPFLEYFENHRQVLERHVELLSRLQNATIAHLNSHPYRTEISNMRKRAQACIEDIENLRTWQLRDMDTLHTPTQSSASRAADRTLKRRSESVSDTGMDLDSDNPPHSKRRRIIKQEMDTLKEEWILPSTEHHATGGSEPMGRRSSSPTSGTRSRGDTSNQHRSKRSRHIKEEDEFSDMPTGAPISNLKTESPLPNRVKLESPALSSSDGVFIKAESPMSGTEGSGDLKAPSPPWMDEDLVTRMLANKAETDPELKLLMKAVASGNATSQQTQNFKAYTDEFEKLIEQPKAEAAPEIEYEDLSAEVEERLRSDAERRRLRGSSESKPASKRKRDRGSGGSEGQSSTRETLGRGAKAARTILTRGASHGVTA